MANKITVLLDLVTDKATTAAKGFKASIADAEGAANKFKAGASSAFATVQANAGALALGAGAALATFGAKSIAAFQDTAIAAGKFSEATGIAIEDASRLQEVAGDLGVSADAVAGTVTRLQKAVASQTDAVKELGIETKRTQDGQVDVLATYLDAIDKLGGVEDANRRALLASQLFGKGFADSAELILGSADDIKQRLDEVSSAQIITEAELAKAKKFRDQMDDLADSMKQVELVAGEALIPVLGDLAAFLVTVEENAGKAKNAIEDIPGGKGLLDALGTNLFELPKKSKQEWDDLGRKIGILPDKIEEIGSKRAIFNQMVADANAANDAFGGLAPSIDEAGTGIDGLGSQIQDFHDDLNRAGQGMADFGDAVEDALARKAVEAADRFRDAIQAVLDAVDEASQGVRDRIDMEGLLDDITEQFGKIEEAGKKAAENGEQGTRDYRDEVRRLRLQLLDLLGDLDNLSAKDKIRLTAEIERGSVDELFQTLVELEKGIVVPVSFSQTPQQGFTGVNFAIPSGSLTPQTIVENPNPAPVNNSQTTIIYPVGSSPTTVAIDQNLYTLRNGPR